LNLPIEEKIAIISRDVYRADGIELSDLAKQQIETYTRQGYGNLPSSYRRSLDLRLLYVCCVHAQLTDK
jgi:formyltetrahydrofolate synthetase